MLEESGGRPAAGAHVVFVGIEDGIVARYSADEQGEVGQPSTLGSFLINAKHYDPNARQYFSAAATIENPGAESVIEVILQAHDDTVQVYVKSPGGPVEGALVNLYDRKERHQAVTDASGFATLNHIPYSAALIIVGEPQAPAWKMELDLARPENRFVVVEFNGPTLTFRITDPSGLSETICVGLESAADLSRQESRYWYLQPDSEAIAFNVRAGSYLVSVGTLDPSLKFKGKKSSYAGHVYSINIADEDMRITHQLESAADVRLNVLDALGEQLTSARVRIIQLPQRTRFESVARTLMWNVNGRGLISVPTGEVMLAVDAAGVGYGEILLHVNPGNSIDATVNLRSTNNPLILSILENRLDDIQEVRCFLEPDLLIRTWAPRAVQVAGFGGGAFASQANSAPESVRKHVDLGFYEGGDVCLLVQLTDGRIIRAETPSPNGQPIEIQLP